VAAPYKFCPPPGKEYKLATRAFPPLGSTVRIGQPGQPGPGGHSGHWCQGGHSGQKCQLVNLVNLVRVVTQVIGVKVVTRVIGAKLFLCRFSEMPQPVFFANWPGWFWVGAVARGLPGNS